MARDRRVVRRGLALAATLALAACGVWSGGDDPLLTVPGELALTPLPPPGYGAAAIAVEFSPILYSGPGSEDARARHYRLEGGAGPGFAAVFRPPGPEGRLAIVLAPSASIAAATAEPGGVWARTTAFKTAESAVGLVRYAPFETEETRCVWFQSVAVGAAAPAHEGSSLWGSYCLGRDAPAPQVFSRGIVRGLRLRAVADTVDAPAVGRATPSPADEPLADVEAEDALPAGAADDAVAQPPESANSSEEEDEG